VATNCKETDTDRQTNISENNTYTKRYWR